MQQRFLAGGAGQRVNTGNTSRSTRDCCVPASHSVNDRCSLNTVVSSCTLAAAPTIWSSNSAILLRNNGREFRGPGTESIVAFADRLPGQHRHIGVLPNKGGSRVNRIDVGQDGEGFCHDKPASSTRTGTCAQIDLAGIGRLFARQVAETVRVVQSTLDRQGEHHGQQGGEPGDEIEFRLDVQVTPAEHVSPRFSSERTVMPRSAAFSLSILKPNFLTT